MRTMIKKTSMLFLVATFLLVGGLTVATQAFAAPGAGGLIPYSVIGTNEYNLPVNFDEPINLLLSYNVWQNTTQYYGDDLGDSSLFVTANKFARLFTIDGLDNVGFLWEAVLGYAGALGDDGTNTNGMLDPKTGFVVWTKPVPNWTAVLEYWLILPWGSNELTDGSVDHQFAWMNNLQLFDGKLVIDWDFGYYLKCDSRKGGERWENGDSVFTNWVVTYKHNPWINPAFHLDYETGEHSERKDAVGTLPSFDRLQIGLGNSMKITDRLLFDVWYSRGISGRNVGRTNAVYARFIWSF